VFSSTYPPTPPVQLPTPLPDERLPVMQYTGSAIDPSLTTEESENDTSGPQLIDFDTPTPPRPPLPLHPEDVNNEQFVDEDGMGVSRTPPFREAQLPKDSPPPLPVRPRLSYQRHSNVILDNLRDDDGHSLSGDMPSIGHRRPPNLSQYVLPHFLCSNHHHRFFFYGESLDIDWKELCLQVEPALPLRLC